MKKIFITLNLLIFSSALISQSLVLTGSTVVSGSIDDFGIESHIIVKNISNNTLNILCEKTVISEPATGSNDFCWGGTCYGAGTMVSTKLDTLDAGEETNGFTGYFHPFIPGPATPGTAIIQYCFYPESDITDSSCLTVTYHANEITSDNKLSLDPQIGSFFPNPSSDYTNISYNLNTNAILQITDILGNLVKEIEIQGSGEELIYVGDLHKGVYFGSLIIRGQVLQIKKLIINK